ncbi:alpha/beta hydrolase [Spirosoma sp. SC4-14]|uniref:alpha/beta fold hydrolase n=1 Tax=Spirosoma sp. SC4-14 TaxID=3128900 RepID=UPI0030CD59E3
MKSIYIFSGLGADERVFKHLDFSGFDTTFIRWTQPTKGETIEHYACRLKEQIGTERPILLGLSFGGIMAIEVAKHIDTEKIIIIASAKTKNEIPFYYRLAGRLNIHKLLPIAIMKRPNVLSYWFFGTQSNNDKRMLANILHDTNAEFLKWSIDKIVKWKNQTLHKNLMHIHGTADKILPLCFVDCDLKVSCGGHFMTVNKADELTKKIRRLL